MRTMTTAVIAADNAAHNEASLRIAAGNTRRGMRFQRNGRRSN